jgi:hypothetical protein
MNAMHRRDFIRKSAVAGVTGSAIINGLYMNNLFGNSQGAILNIDIPSPYLNKLRVKPVLTTMYHTGVWEGPCRFNVTTMEEEKKHALSQFENFRRDMNSGSIDSSIVDLMEPGQVLFVEDFKISEEEFNKIEEDVKTADVLYISPVGCSISNFDVARRYGKPIVLGGGLSCRTVDISAYCRSHGLECYVPGSAEETNQIFTLLKARKSFSQTRILYPTNWKWPSVCSIAGIDEPEKLKDRFGIDITVITYEELSKEMDRVKYDKTLQHEAVEMADIMYSNADRSFIDKKYVVNSMEFYQCVVNLMKKYDCNAFTIECFEFCTSRLPQKWNITPCLVHTMLRDLGIPSACEGDLGGLLAMHMLMSLSNKSPHFGNMFYQTDGKGVLTVNHSVPGIKMNGFDKPGLPYQLAHFVESGWGTKAVVDFMNNDVKDVMVARMNPAGTGILALKGRLVGSRGWNEDLLGCNVHAYIVGRESGSAEEFVRKQTDYGNHLPWVYGDYSGQLKDLCDLMGVEVVIMS